MVFFFRVNIVINGAFRPSQIRVVEVTDDYGLDKEYELKKRGEGRYSFIPDEGYLAYELELYINYSALHIKFTTDGLLKYYMLRIMCCDSDGDNKPDQIYIKKKTGLFTKPIILSQKIEETGDTYIVVDSYLGGL